LLHTFSGVDISVFLVRLRQDGFGAEAVGKIFFALQDIAHSPDSRPDPGSALGGTSHFADEGKNEAANDVTSALEAHLALEREKVNARVRKHRATKKQAEQLGVAGPNSRNDTSDLSNVTQPEKERSPTPPKENYPRTQKKSPPKGGQKKRAALLPDGFEPELSVALVQGYSEADARSIRDKFETYYRDQQGRRKDWHQTWVDWVSRETAFRRERLQRRDRGCGDAPSKEKSRATSMQWTPTEHSPLHGVELQNSQASQQSDPFVYGVINKLLKHGLKLSKDLKLSDVAEVYQSALKDLPRDAIETVRDNLSQGKHEKFCTFIPRPAEFARLVRQSNAGGQRSCTRAQAAVEAQLMEVRELRERSNLSEEEKKARRAFVNTIRNRRGFGSYQQNDFPSGTRLTARTSEIEL
jgi:hypothetical protein